MHYASVLGQRPSGFEYFDGEAYRLLPMGGAVTVNNVEAYHVAALASLGIIQVPLLSVRDALARGELVEVVPQLVAEPMPLTLLYAQRRHLPRRVRVFMDWLAGLLTPHLAPLPTADTRQGPYLGGAQASLPSVPPARPRQTAATSPVPGQRGLEAPALSLDAVTDARSRCLSG